MVYDGGMGSVPEEFVRELRKVIASPASTLPPESPPPSLPRVHPLDTFTRVRRVPSAVSQSQRTWKGMFLLAPWFVGAGIVVAGLLYVSQYGLRMKSQVIRQGNAAIVSVLKAKADAEQFNWQGAHADFERARAEFDAAGRSLGIFGPAIASVLGKLPGLSSVRTGHDLLLAGQLLSDAGASITNALVSLGKAGESSSETHEVVLTGALEQLDTAFRSAARNVDRADALLQNISVDQIPEENRSQLSEFKERLPALRKLIDTGSATVAFARSFLGEDRPRRYLVLFQNSSELRPTGGFPGSYGLLTTEGGRVKDWRADDIYNPDGQIKELIVPPLQLQHITPGWGMRDANWFADFVHSGQKVMEYWRRGGGASVDGVLAIRPDVLASILEVIGPVSLSAYDTTVTAENALATLQMEVEQNRASGKPKQIIADLAPIILDRLAALPSARWPQLVNIFLDALNHRDLLIQFSDASMQAFADDRQWSGRVVDTRGDYLMVLLSNIKGVKADAVTDTALKLESRVEHGTLVHRLTLKRRHDGGTTPYGFYNKANYSYVRVLVPHGSTLRGITGNDRPDNRPIMAYDSDAARDPDLEQLEATYQYHQLWDATTYEESNKTGFGFWMKVEPGHTTEVQLEYAVPAAAFPQQYTLYVQRQPGLDISDFELTLDKPELVVATSSPALTEWPDSWRLHSDLEEDLEFTAMLR
jgi:uncharacterized protein DUF4012